MALAGALAGVALVLGACGDREVAVASPTTPAPTQAAAAATAAPAAPVPVASATPAALDSAVAARAGAAADAYLAERGEVRPDPEDELRLADAETALALGEALLAAREPLRAGGQYERAARLVREVPAERRPLLGKRWSRAEARCLALARALLAVPLAPATAAPAQH